MVDIRERERAPNGEFDVRPDAAEVPGLVRLMTRDDSAWLNDLCRRRYSKHYDPVSTLAWFQNVVLPNPMKICAVRTADAFLIVTLSVDPWTPTSLIADVTFICADDEAMWQAMHLLRWGLAWAKQRKVAIFRLGVGYDNNTRLDVIARRLGAQERHPIYIFDLRGSDGCDRRD